MELDTALHVMSEAANLAATTLLEMQSGARRLQSRKDFLTDADLLSEQTILRHLYKHFPDIPSFSEEKGGVQEEHGYVWVIDPIDGTINFFQQNSHWGISIALVKDSKTIASVIAYPGYGRVATASLQVQTTCIDTSQNPHSKTACVVSQQRSLKDSQIWVGWGKEENEGRDHQRVYDVIKNLDQSSLYPQIRNSATADLMEVFMGNIQGYVLLKPDPFDVAAAGLLVQQAGGTVTDENGDTWGPFSKSLVASNGHIHSELLDVIRMIHS